MFMMSSTSVMMSFVICYDVIYITGDVISYDVIISILTALYLSKDHLRNVFMNTRNLSLLCFHLSIPHDIERDGVDNITEYYHNSTHSRKVRKLIFNLDDIGDTALADSVMDYAEPPAGMYTICIMLYIMSMEITVIVIHNDVMFTSES